MEALKLLTQLGIDLNLAVVVVTIVASGIAMKLIFNSKKNKKKLKKYRILCPFILGIIFYIISNEPSKIVWNIQLLWNGLIHAIFSVGLYAPIKSFLKNKGINVGV